VDTHGAWVPVAADSSAGFVKIYVADFFFFNVKIIAMKGVSSFWEKENFGKLFIRLFLGLFFVASGIRYFAGGISALQGLGAIFSAIGMTFWPAIFGIFAAVILILSGMCFLIGFFYRLNCGLLLLVFFLKALANGYRWQNFFDAEFLLNILIALLLFAFLFIGAGRFSSDGK
jgi:uncharacterized membrane protein YphA (DoxX/SURF4 family)